MPWEVLYRRHITFTELEALQFDLHRQVQANPQLRFLLISQPRPTLTCGRGGAASDLLLSEELLAARGISCVRVDRGGKWTYHGPDQILLYPICSLQQLGFSRAGVRDFVHTFRKCILTVVHQLGLSEAAEREEPYGIYLGNHKLTSFGLRIEKGIARHGAAIYYESADQAFSYINPCGVPGQPTTSLTAEGVAFPWIELAERFSESVKNGLKSPIKPIL